MIRSILLVGLLLAVWPVLTYAGANETQEKLKQVESKLNQRKADADNLDQKAQEENQALATLRQQLVGATEALQDKQEDQKSLQDKQQDLADDIAAKQKDLAAEKEKFGQLTSALIELGRLPPESLILQKGLTNDFIHRAIYVRAILPRIRDQAESLARDLILLQHMKSHLSQQEKLTAQAGENLNQQRQKLDQLMQAKQGLLQKTQQQKDELQRQLATLSDQANDLRQLLDKLAPKKVHKPLTGAPPVQSFRWPVAGQVVRRFGDKDADGVRSEGLSFTVLPGAPVVAPAAGHVVFAGPFKGYGPIVIVQHGGGYHSFLSGFGRIDIETGEDVDAGEPLGVMPVKASGKPELYFEWRYNGEPIDPTVTRKP